MGFEACRTMNPMNSASWSILESRRAQPCYVFNMYDNSMVIFIGTKAVRYLSHLGTRSRWSIRKHFFLKIDTLNRTIIEAKYHVYWYLFVHAEKYLRKSESLSSFEVCLQVKMRNRCSRSMCCAKNFKACFSRIQKVPQRHSWISHLKCDKIDNFKVS